MLSVQKISLPIRASENRNVLARKPFFLRNLLARASGLVLMSVPGRGADEICNCPHNHTLQMQVRPLQFNYLSYELFLEKKSCQTPKKKEKKSHLWCLTDESGFEIFCQTPKKKF